MNGKALFGQGGFQIGLKRTYFWMLLLVFNLETEHAVNQKSQLFGTEGMFYVWF